MKSNDFIFVGYLIQEPYWKALPRREGYSVATIEREFHPVFNKFQWSQVGGIENPTRFLPQLPKLDDLSLEPHKCRSVLHKMAPGWVISGYALPKDIVEHKKLTSVDGKSSLLEFAYAKQLHRQQDGLELLGYELVYDDDLFSSILNNAGYTVEQVRVMGGPLNEYSLLSSIEDAERFKKAIEADPKHRSNSPAHDRTVIVQIWG